MKFWNLWDKYGIYIISIIVLFIFAILSPNMATKSNIFALLSQVSIVAVAAAGMTFAITGGGFDLSVGSTVAVTTCVIAKNIPIIGFFPSIILALLVGAVFGIVNGLIITKLKIQTFVATMATMIIFRGLALIYTDGKDAVFSGFTTQLKYLSAGRFMGIPVPVYITLAVFILAYILYKYTSFGLSVRGVGSNEIAAKISGIKVDRTIIGMFVLTSLSASISGIILTSQLLVGNGKLGVGFEIDVITAAILGGTSLSGGRGKIWGTLMAAILLAMIKNGLNLLNVGDSYQRLATGLILIFALSISGIKEIYNKKIVI